MLTFTVNLFWGDSILPDSAHHHYQYHLQPEVDGGDDSMAALPPSFILCAYKLNVCLMHSPTQVSGTYFNAKPEQQYHLQTQELSQIMSWISLSCPGFWLSAPTSSTLKPWSSSGLPLPSQRPYRHLFLWFSHQHKMCAKGTGGRGSCKLDCFLWVFQAHTERHNLIVRKRALNCCWLQRLLASFISFHRGVSLNELIVV